MFVQTGMRPTLLTILLLCFFCCQCQQKKIDSLLAINNNYTREDSIKVEHIIKLMRGYNALNDSVQMEAYAVKAITIAKKLPQTKSLSRVYNWLGITYHGKSKYLKAIEAYNNCITVAEKRDDKALIAGVYMSLSDLYTNIPDYSKALEAADKAVNLYNAIGDTSEIYGVYMNIGNIYNKLHLPVKAVEYIKKALANFEKENLVFNYGIYEAHSGLAESYLIATADDLLQMGVQPAQKYDLVLQHLFMSLKEDEKDGTSLSEMGKVNTRIGTVYQEMGNKTLALKYYLAAIEVINKRRDNQADLSNVWYRLGNYYLDNGDYAKSKTYFHQSLQLSHASGLFAVQRDVLEKLSILYEKTNRYDSAYFFYKQYTAVRDTIFNLEKEKEITRKQLQLDFAVKENEYKLTQQINDDKLRQQQIQLGSEKKAKWLLITGIILTIIFAGFMLHNQRKTKKLNHVINEQKLSLEQLGNVKDKIFSVVSHDMRAPVNSLISFIDILDNGNIGPDKLNLYAKELKQNLSYTSALMNNLLNWAASQMQGFKPVKENFDIAVKVDDVVNTLQHHLQQKNVSLQNMVTSNTIATADPDMTAAILRNLISNAIKYSYQGGTITIAAKNSAAGCMVTIKDEGTGMDAEQIAAFNSNDQLQAESKRGTANEKGTGLGLLLCKTFARQMNGTITATKDETGMSFSLWLPLN